jgi:two-component system NtrC family sensor kinase
VGEKTLEGIEPRSAAVRGRGRPASIQSRLVRDFSVAIVIPAVITAFVGVRTIQQRVFAQAQAQVNSDLELMKVIYQDHLDRLKDALRIHATRMIVYGALSGRGTSELGAEMDRIRLAENLDVLTLVDASGRVFYRTRNPGRQDEGPLDEELVRLVLASRAPVAATGIASRDELERDSLDLVRQASMELTPTPRARVDGKTRLDSGLMLKGAAPVFTPGGRLVGVLFGGLLLTRNNELVDRITRTVFKEELYQGRAVGTATIFQDDVRVSTNVRNQDGTRAVGTRVSAEVADEVLTRGATWRGRAFVVNAYYLAAYAPIRDIRNMTVGMLYVGILEQPYIDSLWRSLYVFLGIAILGAGLVSFVAIKAARRISQPIHEMAEAARKIARGDYEQKVTVSSEDEIGHLASSFNAMTSELSKAHQDLQEWAENLERKVEQRTAELRAMQAHLLQAEKMAAIGKLAAGVAHEINNPLTGILTNSSLMLDEVPADDPRRDDLETIVNETLRCRRIVKGLLDFARQTEPQKKSLSLNKVVEDILALVRNQASFRDIRTETRLDPNLPAVMADGDQIRQVVLNIVLNAAEAMPRGGDLRIETRVDLRRGVVELRVSDTGLGIPDEIKDKLFEPFFTTKKAGTGLGLAVAYGIIERHRGTITVRSTPGRGATFEVVLPVSHEEAA